MAELLPLFPLNTVLFPGMLLPLHVFEPRYRLLVRRCLDKQQPFGIVLIESGAEVGGIAVPKTVGTTAEIVGNQPLPDGRSFIVVNGLRRFHVDQLIDDEEPYLLAKVSYLAEDEGAGASELADRAADAFTEYLLAALAAADEPHSEAPDLDAMRHGTPADVAYRIAAGLAIDALERQRLLEAPNAQERLTSEIRLLERESTLLKELLLRLRARGEGPTLN
ncbi:MAG: LON peptidase substrate-binding domain-containing protein [Chloroflexi bacterium]|nr:LON peptidase substrate-binding domain-containing protein [Chloroflexota bacterium]